MSTSWLTFFVIAPLLAWGLWIISEESFDELNSRRLTERNLFARFENFLSIGRPEAKSTEENLRESRKRLLPFYFLALIVITSTVYFVLVEERQYLAPLSAITLILSFVFLQNSRRMKKAMEENSRMLERELPTQIQLMTILISAGMTPAKAISILSTRSDSLSSRALRELVSEVEMGLTIVAALDNLANRFDSMSLRRLITSLVLGIERGSALGPILISQVRDARMASKSEVMRRAGKAEIGLMVPVVFLILPISILFALWPSYQQLGSFL